MQITKIRIIQQNQLETNHIILTPHFLGISATFNYGNPTFVITKRDTPRLNDKPILILFQYATRTIIKFLNWMNLKQKKPRIQSNASTRKYSISYSIV